VLGETPAVIRRPSRAATLGETTLGIRPPSKAEVGPAMAEAEPCIRGSRPVGGHQHRLRECSVPSENEGRIHVKNLMAVRAFFYKKIKAILRSRLIKIEWTVV
jgi:hypothetical protein